MRELRCLVSETTTTSNDGQLLLSLKTVYFESFVETNCVTNELATLMLHFALRFGTNITESKRANWTKVNEMKRNEPKQMKWSFGFERQIFPKLLIPFSSPFLFFYSYSEYKITSNQCDLLARKPCFSSKICSYLVSLVVCQLCFSFSYSA